MAKEKKEKEKKEKVELTEEQKVEKKRRIKLISLIVLVSIIGMLFISTYLRWQRDISDKYQIIYYKQEGIKVDTLKDFFGADVSLDIDDNEAIVMYCSDSYGKDCITADYNSFLENFLRDPIIVVSIVIIIDLLLVYKLIKKIYIKDIFKLVAGIVIILYGLGLSFMQLYQIAEYYIFVNNKFETTATIYKKVITSSENKFQPIVQYTINDEEYTSYLDTAITGKIEDKVGEEINIHYYRNNKETIVNKKFVLWRIIPFILGIVILIEGTRYLPKYRIVEDTDKSEEKDSKKKKAKK